MFYYDYCLLLLYIIFYYETAFCLQNKDVLRERLFSKNSFFTFPQASEPVNIQMFVKLCHIPKGL